MKEQLLPLSITLIKEVWYNTQEKIHKTHNGLKMEYYWEYQSSH